MAYNACSGVSRNIFGPPEQTLFLGCSISSFSVNVGWNEQVGEVTVSLAQDTCPVPTSGNPKVYYDSNLQRQTTMAADPGFIEPNIGAPVYFRAGDFEWCGLVQNFTSSTSLGGKPVYTVKLIDPRQILDGAQIIVGEYADTVSPTPNLINAYAYAESFGTSSPPNVIAGATFGSPAGGFGGSLSNDNGMPWYVIKEAVSVLTSSTPRIVNNYSPYGRLTFRSGYGTMPSGSPSLTVGYGIIPGDSLLGQSLYTVDLSEMPQVPNYWRIAGTSVSLMEAISQVCSDACSDYYVELVPTYGYGGIQNIIKIRTASRVAVPTLGAIQSFVDNAGNAVQFSKGLEMRNEVVSSFVVGGNVQSIYQAEQDDSLTKTSWDIISPFFGLDIYGNVLETSAESGIWHFQANLLDLNAQLNFPLPISTAKITEYELLAAQAGYDTWLMLGEQNAFDFETVRAMNHTEDSIFNPELIERNSNAGLPNPPAIDLLTLGAGAVFPSGDTNADNVILTSAFDRDSQTVFSFVSAIASQFYGRKFMVRLPYTTGKIDPDSQQNNGRPVIKTTEVPSDGGWTDEDNVIGLQTQSSYLDFFTLPDNRLGCFVGLAITDAGVDVSSLNPEDYWVTTNQKTGADWVYIRANVEPDIVYLDKNTLYSPRVIVTLDQPVTSLSSDNYLDGLPAHMAAMEVYYSNKSPALKAKMSEALINNSVGTQSVWNEFPPRSIVIHAAAVPILSNVQTYGPWLSPMTVHGITKIEKDGGLVPWEYGSTYNMNLVGSTRALNETASSMQFGETGSVEVPGYPTLPIGAELGAYNGGFFAGGQHLFETRSIGSGTGGVTNDNYCYVDSGGPWTGIYGPNITSIGVEFGLNGVTTNYAMRTFSPAFGRFSKLNSERLKQFGQQGLRMQKAFRFAKLTQARRTGGIDRGNAVQAIGAREAKSKLKKGKLRHTDSPHEILVGQTIPWFSGDGMDGYTSRSIVATEEAADLAKEFSANYDKKAFASMDAFFRPVSMYGDGDLPRYMVPSIPITEADDFAILDNDYSSAGAMPPLLVPSGNNTGSYTDAYKLSATSQFLNPYNSNPAYMHGSGSGHDITVLGHGSVVPSSMNMYVEGDGTHPHYHDDYRTLAWKGPLILTQWGLDTNGKPVPNFADSEDAIVNSGEFAMSGLQDRYLPNWLTKSHTWPVAPVDLRLDRKRGVWVSPPSHKLVIGLALERISAHGQGLCQLVEGNLLYDASGNKILPKAIPCWCAPRFVLTEKIGDTIASGTVLIAYYEADRDEYWALERTGGRNDTTSSSTTTSGPTTSTTYNPLITCGVSNCKWTWSGTAWDKTENNCGGTTTSTTAAPSGTTTSTAAPSGTTTSTADPCGCPTTTSTAAPSGTTTSTAPPSGTTTSTTSGPTTTTTAAPCVCSYPSYCGLIVGECTYTSCIGSGSAPTETSCPSTTTSTTTPAPTGSTTSSTTSTTPDCSSTPAPPTTEDPAANCGGSCSWYGNPILGYWVQQSDCGDAIDCLGWDACGNCAYPSAPYVKCGNTSTPCIVGPKPGCPSSPGGGCGGYYTYWCIFGTWVVDMANSTGCTGIGAVCQSCDPPAQCYGCTTFYTISAGCQAGGAPNDSQCKPCVPVRMGCRGVECPDCPGTTADPCNPETPTSPIPPTTTTANPCGPGCWWEADSSLDWVFQYGGCSGGCACYEPAGSPLDTCETAYTVCMDITTPPPTTTPPTTTVPPTTTPPTTTTTNPWWCSNSGCSPYGSEGGVCFQATIAVATGDALLCAGPFGTEAECHATFCKLTTTTTTSAKPWWCITENCGLGIGGSCLALTELEAIYDYPYTLCDGPFDTESGCLYDSMCAITTTTTGAPWYCCNIYGGASCNPLNNRCIQTPCADDGIPSDDCNPGTTYTSESGCIAACNLTTTCSPSEHATACSTYVTYGCTLICNASNGWEYQHADCISTRCDTQGCYCQSTPETDAMVASGICHAGVDANIYLGCRSTPTSTTAAP